MYNNYNNNNIIIYSQNAVTALVSGRSGGEVSTPYAFFLVFFPPALDVNICQGELEICRKVWKNVAEKCSGNAIEAFSRRGPNVFPNIKRHLQILTKMPVWIASGWKESQDCLPNFGRRLTGVSLLQYVHMGE